MKNGCRDIVIREMTLADLTEVLDIERDSYPHPWNRDHFLDELGSEHSFPLVAIDADERIAGYICQRFLLDEGHILNVAVRRSSRGSGIGRMLVEAGLEGLRERGAVIVYLEVRRSNSTAIGLYRQLGFLSTGERRRYYENGEDAILMELRFPGGRPKMQFKAMVMSNFEVSPGYLRMRLASPPEVSCASPGQFVMIKVRDSIDPLLRRPFGIFDLGTADGHFHGGKGEYLEILYKVVGKGTDVMAKLHHGDFVDILGPLGKGFDSGDPGAEKILVGGGVGVAPLYYLAKGIAGRSPLRLFAGGRNRDDIICITEFERLGVETYVSTDDGTLGERGVVTEALKSYLANNPVGKSIFACGPFPMLKEVAKISARMGIPCQVSLEAHMACGVGACLGCVVKGRNHSEAAPDYRCVCKEGPVFDSSELMWD